MDQLKKTISADTKWT